MVTADDIVIFCTTAQKLEDLRLYALVEINRISTFYSLESNQHKKPRFNKQ